MSRKGKITRGLVVKLPEAKMRRPEVRDILEMYLPHRSKKTGITYPLEFLENRVNARMNHIKPHIRKHNVKFWMVEAMVDEIWLYEKTESYTPSPRNFMKPRLRVMK